MDRKNSRDSESVADRLRTMCSRREYCTCDVLRKALAYLDGNREEAERVVDSLRKERYVDDRRYASAYARDKASIAGWGEAKIRYMLSGKGISSEDIAAALQDIDEQKAEVRMDRLLRTKYASLKDDPQCKVKLLRFALGRGYRYDDALPVVDEIMSNI